MLVQKLMTRRSCDDIIFLIKHWEKRWLIPSPIMVSALSGHNWLLSVKVQTIWKAFYLSMLQGLAYQRRYLSKATQLQKKKGPSYNPTPINIPTLVSIINASATLTCSAQIRPWEMSQNSCRQVSCLDTSLRLFGRLLDAHDIYLWETVSF